MCKSRKSPAGRDGTCATRLQKPQVDTPGLALLRGVCEEWGLRVVAALYERRLWREKSRRFPPSAGQAQTAATVTILDFIGAGAARRYRRQRRAGHKKEGAPMELGRPDDRSNETRSLDGSQSGTPETDRIPNRCPYT